MLSWYQAKAIAYLRAAQSLIADPVKWTSGCQAVDASGLVVPPTHPSAVAWSARGALIRVTCYTRTTVPVLYGVHTALDFAVPCWCRGDEDKDQVELLNDHELMRHEDIIELYERAINLMKAGG